MTETNKINSPTDIIENIEKVSMDLEGQCIETLNQILHKLPKEYSNIINASFKHKRVPKEYCLTSILFSISTSAGTVFHTNDLGFKNYANLYFIIVGSRGDAKSEGLSIGTKPINEIDDELYDDYLEDVKHSNGEEQNDVVRKQTLIQNATIEAATQVHKNNPSGIGLYQDECYQLFEKMGNPNSRDGIEWRTLLLESYTNKHIDISRKTTESFRLNQTFITFIGGVQHQFIPQMFSNGNLDSGLIDRMLFVNKLTHNNKFNDESISEDIEIAYSKAINNILEYKVWSENPKADCETFLLHFSSEARELLKDHIKSLIELQNHAISPIKEYLSKMQISIHKFCIIAHLMINARGKNFRSTISIETIELAILFNEFYYLNFQLIIDNESSPKVKPEELIRIIQLAKLNDAGQNQVASITGVSTSTIHRKWKKVS